MKQSTEIHTLEELQGLLRSDRLEVSELVIRLKGEELSGHIEELAERLANNTTIKVLDLSSNSLNDDMGVALVLSLKNNYTVISLNLSRNILGNKTMHALAEVLKQNFSLWEIALTSNQKIDNNGISSINDALKVNHHLLQITADQIFNTSLVDNNLNGKNIYIERNNKEFKEVVTALKSFKDKGTTEDLKPWMLNYFQEANSHHFSGDFPNNSIFAIKQFIAKNFFSITGICKNLPDNWSLLPNDLLGYMSDYLKISDVVIESNNISCNLGTLSGSDIQDNGVAVSGDCFGGKCSIM